ncbi:MAG: sulfurtransferase TusA family protein, partial [Candidatus Promineifilaceae bacterium]|jgi:TusA-related sulfurtransferase
LTTEAYQPDITLDFRSLRCPNLLIAVIQEIEQAQPGQILRIETADLNAPSGIGPWTRQSGHILLEMYEDGEDFIFLIQCEAGAVEYQLTRTDRRVNSI